MQDSDAIWTLIPTFSRSQTQHNYCQLTLPDLTGSCKFMMAAISTEVRKSAPIQDIYTYICTYMYSGSSFISWTNSYTAYGNKNGSGKLKVVWIQHGSHRQTTAHFASSNYLLTWTDCWKNYVANINYFQVQNVIEWTHCSTLAWLSDSFQSGSWNIRISWPPSWIFHFRFPPSLVERYRYMSHWRNSRVKYRQFHPFTI